MQLRRTNTPRLKAKHSNITPLVLAVRRVYVRRLARGCEKRRQNEKSAESALGEEQKAGATRSDDRNAQVPIEVVSAAARRNSEIVSPSG